MILDSLLIFFYLQYLTLIFNVQQHENKGICFMRKVVFLTSLIMLSLPSYAAVNCNGVLKNKSILESIKVKKKCTLENLIIHGDVILEDGAIAELNNNHIKGNVIASSKFRTFSATDNLIQGHVRLSQGKNIDLKDNTVKGNLSLQNNTGVVKIYANQINGNLSCNRNAFTINGSKNMVSGNKQMQCQTF
jgi:hypothetical protein